MSASVLAGLLVASGLTGAVPAAPAQAVSVCTMGTHELQGVGSPGDPCLIEDRSDLEALRDAVNDGANQAGVHFRQVADIDLSGVDSWVAIGTGSGSTSFRGSYDGDFNRVTGLTIRATGQPDGVQYFGLFGYVRDGGIERLRLTGVDLDVSLAGETSGSRYAGGLAAYVQSNGSGPTIISSVSVEGRVRIAYAGDNDVYVGGVIGRGRSRASLEDRISFIGEVGGRFATSDADANGNFGGLIGRMSQDAALSLGYARVDLDVEVTTVGGDPNAGDVLAGVLTGSSSSRDSDLEELYAVGSVRVAGALGNGQGFTGVVGYIESDADTFTDIFHVDTLPFAGRTASGFVPADGLQNVVALTEGQMQGANAEQFMSGSDGRWEFQNGVVAPVADGKWFLALAPAGFPVFSWEVGLPNSIITTDITTDISPAPSATAPTFVLTPDGSLPTLESGAGQWQQGAAVTSLVASSAGSGQVRYVADGIRVTFTGAAGTGVSRGLVADPNGEVVCEVCGDPLVGEVIEVWLFSSPRLVAAHLVGAGQCQTFSIPVVAPLDGGGPVSAGAHTLQLALPTVSGMQAVNVGVTVGGPVPASVPAGEGPAVPVWLLAFGLLAAAGAAVAERRQAVIG